MTSLEWGSCAGEQIPQTGELLSDRNGDGVFREENTMLPMLTIAVAVPSGLPSPLQPASGLLMPKRIVSGGLMPAEGISETG